MLLSPIAVDQGAKHTGVCLTHYGAEAEPLSHGLVLEFPDHGMTLLQGERRAKRHQRRGQQRHRLARRLLGLLLEKGFGLRVGNLEPRQREALWGLINRRGYTYLTEDNEEMLEALRGANSQHLETLMPDIFTGEGDPVQLLERHLQDKVGRDRVRQNEALKLAEGHGEKLLRQRLQESLGADPEKEAAKNCKKALVAIRQMAENAAKSNEGGHHARVDYLENIGQDIKTHPNFAFLRAAFGSRLSAFINALSHLANLPLRPLRRYFNDRSMKGGQDRWNEARLQDCVCRALLSWKCGLQGQGDGDAGNFNRNRRELLDTIGAKGLLHAWSATDPALSIPPYEDMDNRHPPRCQALVLDIEKLDKSHHGWKDLTARIAGLYPDVYGDMKPHASDREAARVLQRCLDRSRDTDPWRLQGPNRGDSSEAMAAAMTKRERDLGENCAEMLLVISETYVEERRQAERGNLDAENARLLCECGGRPRHKGNMADLLLEAILGAKPESGSGENTLAKLEKIMPEIFEGRKTVKGLCEDAAKAVKIYGNGLKHRIDMARKKRDGDQDEEDKKLLSLDDRAHQAAGHLAERLKLDPRPFSSAFSLSQIYNILYEDRHGFARTCPVCAEEDARRSRVGSEGHALARRLPSRALRPFDGFLRRMLEIQARRIARAKAEQLLDAGVHCGEVLIPLLIEENRFLFASDLAEAKKLNRKSKEAKERYGHEEDHWRESSQRIRYDGKGLCPYTGAALGGAFELDHIVPRSITREARGGQVFNSEANLIACSNEGNIQKGDDFFTLGDLASNYLLAVFGTADTGEVENTIRREFAPMQDSKGIRAAFHELSDKERRALRHALFVDDLRAAVLNILPGQIQTRVNGTQRFFAALIRKHLGDLAKRELPGVMITFETARVESLLVHRLREVLAAHRPELAKGEPQGAYSHVVDAALLYPAWSWQKELKDHAEAPDPESLESPKSLASHLPPEARIERMEARPKWEREPPESASLFKDSIFADHFLPILIFGDGEIVAGFARDNGAKLQGNKNAFLNLLRPLLREKDQPLGDGNVEDLARRAAAHPKGRLALEIQRTAAFELLSKVAHEASSEGEKLRADLVEALGYTTVKSLVIKVIIDSGGRKCNSREAILKEKDFLVKVKFGGTRSDFSIQGGAIIPARHDWDRLLERTGLAAHLGGEAPGGLEQRIRKYFLPDEDLNARCRHHRVRKVFSLPRLTDPSGGFRVRRRTPEGWCWQHIQTDGAVFSGFVADGQGGADFKKPVLAPKLLASRNLVPDGHRFQASVPVVPMSEWRECAVPQNLNVAIRSLRIRPGSEGRLEVRFEARTEIVAALTGVAGFESLPVQFKVLKADWNERLGNAPAPVFEKKNGVERSRGLHLEAVGRDFCALSYMTDSKPEWQRVYNSGRPIPRQ